MSNLINPKYGGSIELIVDEGEWTGSFVKLQPVDPGTGGALAALEVAKFSHMTTGIYAAHTGSPLDASASGYSNDITSSFVISGSAGAIEAPIYSFKLAAGAVLAYKSMAGGTFTAP